MYRISRLDNGLTVATAEMPHMASVSLGLWVGTGGRFEPAELNGISHFVEHVLFKGTKRRTAQDISIGIEGIGGYLNAFTSEENTCYYAKAKSDHLNELLDVLMDMYLESTFATREINKERSVIKDELALYLDQPHHHVQEILGELLWPNHPLGRSLTGTFQTIAALSRKQMLHFRSQHYVAPNTLVAVAGPLRHEQVVKKVAPYARRIPDGRRPSYQPAATETSKPLVRCCRKKTSQTQIALGFPACSRHEDRRFPLRLLNTLLGENMSSRLFQVLREDHGLAYSIQSCLNFFDDVGALTISAGIDPPHLKKTLKLMARELKRFVTTPPTARSLRQARDYLVGQLELSLESTENQMMWLGEHLLAYQRVIPPAQIKRNLNQVTPSQIRQIAQEYLSPDRISLAIIGPGVTKTDLLSTLRF